MNADMMGTLRALANQVADPQHCFLKVSGGDFLRHYPDPNDTLDVHSLAGQPVRFSRMAAERVKERLKGSVLGMDVVMVPEFRSCFFGPPEDKETVLAHALYLTEKMGFTAEQAAKWLRV